MSTALIYAIQNSLNQVDTHPSNGVGVVVGDGNNGDSGNSYKDEDTFETLIITEEDFDVRKWNTYTNNNFKYSFKYPRKVEIIDTYAHKPDYYLSSVTIRLKEE